MAVEKLYRKQEKAKKTTVKKSVEKPPVSSRASRTGKNASEKKAPSAKPSACSAKKRQAGAVPTKEQRVMEVTVVRTATLSVTSKAITVSSKPSAQTCPLVLDGIVLAEDFSPRDCFSCDEFDCRFYAAEESSGTLGSRLFVGEDEGDMDDDDVGLFGFDRDETEDRESWGGEEDE